MKTTPKQTPKQIAQQIADACNRLGFRFEIRGSILTIHAHFRPGDLDAFRKCDMMYWEILSLLPQTSPGSVWGTDGGGIGGEAAVRTGHFEEHKSGGSKRVLSALSRIAQ